MSKKLGKKETLGLILSEIAKLRGDVKSLEKQLAGSPSKPKAAAKKKPSKPAAKPAPAAKKQPAASRRPVLVETAPVAPARTAS